MNEKIKCLFLVSLFAFLWLSACSPEKPAETASTSGELSGSITISGAFALYPLMTRWGEEFHAQYPGVTFDISAGGAGKGMTDVLSSAVDIGMVSREIRPEEQEQGAYWVSVAKDAVFPVVNAENPVLADLLVKGITREIFVKIYLTGEITTWGEVVGKPEITDTIHVYTRSDAAGAPEVWAAYLGGVQEDLLGVGVSGDPGLLDTVVKDPLGIGYNNLGYAFDLASDQPVNGAVVVPIDMNGDAVAQPEELLETMSEATAMVAAGKYPSPPARALNLVTNGKPGGIVQVFLQWVLTHGQQYVGEAGYVTLSQDILTESLEKVK